MDKYNLYKSGIRFLKVSLVNIEVKIVTDALSTMLRLLGEELEEAN